MMKLLQFIFIFFALFANPLQAGIVVIVNSENTASGFSQRQLVDLYMGRDLYFPDGSMALRLDQSPTSQVRHDFYKNLVGKSVAQINAYWARLLFTGRASPPQVINDSEGVLKAVRSNANAVGYINESELDAGVKVVGRVN
jgi:ABC-type phosphate transport system substrate-binding protein